MSSRKRLHHLRSPNHAKIACSQKPSCRFRRAAASPTATFCQGVLAVSDPGYETDPRAQIGCATVQLQEANIEFQAAQIRACGRAGRVLVHSSHRKVCDSRWRKAAKYLSSGSSASRRSTAVNTITVMTKRQNSQFTSAFKLQEIIVQ